MTPTTQRPGDDGRRRQPAAPAAQPPATVGEVLAALADHGGAALVSPAPPGAEAVALRDVTHDSRDAGPGVLFACRPGSRVDGHDFGAAAVAAGSPALLVERPVDTPRPVPQLRVPSVAAALGVAAATIHRHPSEEMVLVGVTGTNGKTTSAYLLESVLAAAGHTTGLIGTVETRIAGAAVPGVRTTPEATDLQRLLRRMRQAGVTAAAMEVSSHGLALGRVTGTRFAVALFTNLSHDHLDFHRDLEDYFSAKASLFTPAFTRRAVINVDDPWGRRLAELAAGAGLRVDRVSASGRADADVTAVDVRGGPQGSTFTALLDGRRVEVQTRLPGGFNVSNALQVLAAAVAIGVPAETAARGIAALPGVPGRMERVEAGQPFTVLVDYAHTPDSLEHVLRAAGELRGEGARVIVVVGCGGDRDQAKRPLMGRAAVTLADEAVFTDDNPRSEDPRAILDAIVVGAAEVPGARWRVEPDRRRAIGLALAAAREGDVVVIAGKGHETYQELAGRTIDFDDRVVAREALETLAAGGAA